MTVVFVTAARAGVTRSPSPRVGTGSVAWLAWGRGALRDSCPSDCEGDYEDGRPKRRNSEDPLFLATWSVVFICAVLFYETKLMIIIADIGPVLVYGLRLQITLKSNGKIAIYSRSSFLNIAVNHVQYDFPFSRMDSIKEQECSTLTNCDK